MTVVDVCGLGASVYVCLFLYGGVCEKERDWVLSRKPCEVFSLHYPLSPFLSVNKCVCVCVYTCLNFKHVSWDSLRPGRGSDGGGVCLALPLQLIRNHFQWSLTLWPQQFLPEITSSPPTHPPPTSPQPPRPACQHHTQPHHTSTNNKSHSQPHVHTKKHFNKPRKPRQHSERHTFS